MKTQLFRDVKNLSFRYRIMHGLMAIAQGVLTVFAAPFGYTCNLHLIFLDNEVEKMFDKT